MARWPGSRCWLGLVIATVCVTARAPVLALTTSVPAGSGIIAVGVHPPKNGSGFPLVEHMPLRNLINFEIHFRTTSMAVTFVEGLVEYFDADGNPLLPTAAITVQMFLDQTGLADREVADLGILQQWNKSAWSSTRGCITRCPPMSISLGAAIRRIHSP